MKQVIQKFAFVLLVLALAAPVSLWAQKTDKEKDKSKDKKETEQIIITRKGDKKIVVEVDGDKVTVNGEPLEDYKGEDVVVLHDKIRDLTALNTYGRFLNDYGAGSRAFVLDANRAVLGVVTEKADKGAEIKEVTKESGAEKAGLKKGDLITKIDETKIESPDDLSNCIR
jgi:serine protease Do